jgi:hypothetical protein
MFRFVREIAIGGGGGAGGGEVGEASGGDFACDWFAFAGPGLCFVTDCMDERPVVSGPVC